MLYNTLLTLHMIGLAIGAGTGVYIAAVTRHATKNLDAAQARAVLPGINGTLSRVGSIGLALLLLSGVGMMIVLGGNSFGGWFTAKMILVLAIVVFVGAMHMLAARLRKGDTKAARTMQKIGPIGPILALLTVVSAVVAFH